MGTDCVLLEHCKYQKLNPNQLKQIRNSLVHRAEKEPEVAHAIKGRASGIRPRGLEPTTQTAPEFAQLISQFGFSLGVDTIFDY